MWILPPTAARSLLCEMWTLPPTAARPSKCEMWILQPAAAKSTSHTKCLRTAVGSEESRRADLNSYLKGDFMVFDNDKNKLELVAEGFSFPTSLTFDEAGKAHIADTRL